MGRVRAAIYEVPTPPVAVEETPLFNWTGFTAGVQGGYAWNNNDADFGGGFSADFDGGILGGFVGYNHQLDNNWVIGIEGDLEKNWGDDSLAIGGITAFNYGLDWQGSVRGRVGYAFDRALLYGTAGWAVGRGFLDVPVAGVGQKETFNGFTDMVFGRIEYRYTNFGDKDFDFTGVGGPVINSDLDQHAIRIGLGIKF